MKHKLHAEVLEDTYAAIAIARLDLSNMAVGSGETRAAVSRSRAAIEDSYEILARASSPNNKKSNAEIAVGKTITLLNGLLQRKNFEPVAAVFLERLGYTINGMAEMQGLLQALSKMDGKISGALDVSSLTNMLMLAHRALHASNANLTPPYQDGETAAVGDGDARPNEDIHTRGEAHEPREDVEPDQAAAQFAASLALTASFAKLTPRERLVMERVVAGDANKKIAADLGVSQRTIEHHRQSVMRKMGAKSLPALVRMSIDAQGSQAI